MLDHLPACGGDHTVDDNSSGNEQEEDQLVQLPDQLVQHIEQQEPTMESSLEKIPSKPYSRRKCQQIDALSYRLYSSS